MNSIWRTLHEQAISVSAAGDAFHFDISWLGVIITVAAVVVWRRLLRRR
jgi:hypothetical protein